ncbi:MAG: sensor histidine kinase N-terminal domain-containing protein [Rhizobium sp.]|nr:sensor histidine kinase N-terminal domain-containing protein [Rhizobium sp.]
MAGRPVFNSLRTHLLALLMPVAAVAVLGSVLAVHLVVHEATVEALDESLKDAVELYADALRADPDAVLPELPAHAQRVLLVVPEDRLFFSLQDADGRLLAGVRLADDLPWGSLRKPAFFDLNFGGYWLRGVSVVFAAGEQARHVTVATTAYKRERMMDQILFGMVAPQAVLFLLAIVLVWAGIRQGLAPLAALRVEIGQRSHRDLHPLDPAAAPDELRPIVVEINALFVRLDCAIESQRHFIADAAHQLRTPIAGLLAQLEAAGPGENPALLASARRLARLVTQFLALSRAEPDTEAEPETFDLAALIREEANVWLPQAFQRDIELHFDLAETRLSGSPHAFREILANLVDNAIRYGRPGGNVVVSCASAGEEAVLRVEDDGPGIPPEERGRVFERFYRGRGASADGCGLGLAIVHALARRHGADVRLDAAPRLGGLRIELRVPRKEVRESAA